MTQTTQNAPDQTVENSPKGAAVQPSGPNGKNPATAGPGNTLVKSSTPENREGKINPSAPNDVNKTPDVPNGEN